MNYGLKILSITEPLLNNQELCQIKKNPSLQDGERDLADEVKKIKKKIKMERGFKW